MNKDELRNMFLTEGLDISAQAQDIIMKLAEPNTVAYELIKLMKQRKLILSGGDMIRYIITKKLPDSMINSEDVK